MTFCTAALFFLGAGGADLAQAAAAVYDLNRLAVYQGIGKLFVRIYKQLGDGRARYEHLLRNFALAQMLQIVQAQHLIFINLQAKRLTCRLF